MLLYDGDGLRQQCDDAVVDDEVHALLFFFSLFMPMLIISRPAIAYISGTVIVCCGAVFCFVLVSYVMDYGPGLLSTIWYMQIMEVDDSRRFFV